jgi:hypothetical protein
MFRCTSSSAAARMLPPGTDDIALDLIETTTFTPGVIYERYRPAGDQMWNVADTPAGDEDSARARDSPSVDCVAHASHESGGVGEVVGICTSTRGHRLDRHQDDISVGVKAGDRPRDATQRRSARLRARGDPWSTKNAMQEPS